MVGADAVRMEGEKVEAVTAKAAIAEEWVAMAEARTTTSTSTAMMASEVKARVEATTVKGEEMETAFRVLARAKVEVEVGRECEGV